MISFKYPRNLPKLVLHFIIVSVLTPRHVSQAKYINNVCDRFMCQTGLCVFTVSNDKEYEDPSVITLCSAGNVLGI